MSKLPDTWQEVKLKDIATFSQGLQVAVEEQVSTPIDNYVRFIRIVDYTQKNEDIRFVENKGQRYFASKSDIVMVRYGTPGLVGRGIEGIIANNLFKINLDQKIANNDFFEHLLKSSFVQNKLQSGSASTTMPAINFSTLNTVVIPLPPIEEQKKIADILSTVDKKIAFVEENINATEELKKGLMQKLLTEGIGHTEFKDSELGRIPESWEVKYFKEYAKISVGIATSTTEHFVEKGVPLVRNQNIKENKFDFKELLYISEKFSEDNKTKKIKENDLLVIRTGYPGLTAVVTKEMEGWQTFTTLIVKPNSNLIDSNFIAYYMNSPFGKNNLSKLEAGGAQKNLNSKSLEKLNIPVPPLEEQKQIAKILSTVDKKLENLKEKKLFFEELKKGLMQKLLTAEVRV